MNLLIRAAILILAFSAASVAAQDKTFFQAIAGNWAGTLEYQDYSENKRVKLKTYVTVKPSADGRSAEVLTVYDDFGRIIKSAETETLDLEARKFTSGDQVYQIESVEAGKIVLSSSGQDGDTVEPIRKTITFDENALVFLKETRTPWQFRNQLTLRRTNEDVLAPKTFAPAELKEDLAVLKTTLALIHPGIYRYLSPESLEKEFALTQAKLDKSLPEGEFFLLVAQILSRLKCGHTFANPLNQNALLRERIFNNKTYLPFYFRLAGSKMMITENASPQALAKGSEIKKINGVPVKEIIEKLLTVTKADGAATLGNRIDSLELKRLEAERYALFDWYFPLFFPLESDVFAIEAVDFAARKKVKFQVPAMMKAERTKEMAKRYGAPPTFDDGWKFEIADDSTGYLKIANSLTWRLKTVKFKEFLANAFATLRARNVQNLIVDLRGNDGGDMNPCFELARYLAQKTLPPYAASRRLVRNVAAQPELLKNLDTYSDELVNSLKNGLPESSYKRAENGYFELLPSEKLESFPPVVPYENNFKGKTFIVADAANASATFQFLNYAQENRLATIVGQPTGGNRQGINGGNYFFLRLPHSRIEIDVPVYFQAPLAPQKDEPVVPDVVVKREPQDTGNNYDRELAVIKKLIVNRKSLMVEERSR